MIWANRNKLLVEDSLTLDLARLMRLGLPVMSPHLQRVNKDSTCAVTVHGLRHQAVQLKANTSHGTVTAVSLRSAQLFSG